MATAKTKQKILDTFLELLCEHSYEDVTLAQVAEASKVKLSDMRSAFASKTSLVAAFAESIDTTVLDERDSDMGDQPPRDRLFDILMTRIDAMAPHREAVRALYRAARRDPALALEFNRLETRSQRWMLIAAGIDVSGVKAGIIAQGLAVAFARVVEVWLDEEDEGMPRTMSRLDKELDRGSSLMQRLDRLEGFAGSLRSFMSKAASRAKSARQRTGTTPDEDGMSHEASASA